MKKKGKQIMKKFTTWKISASALSIIMILSMFFSTGVFAAAGQTETTSTGNNSIETSSSGEIGVQYRGHIENYGDTPSSIGPNLNYLTGPDELGTRGQSLRLEGVAIKLTGDVPAGASITYQVHVQDKGWMDPVKDGVFTGTTAQSLRIEAIKINLEGLSGYDVYYRGHVQDKGDVPSTNGDWTWVKNGAELGTTGESLRLEALEIKIVKTNNYVALGDSIAYGMSAAPGSDYADLFYNNLSSISGNEDISLVNQGIPGEKSSGLLYQLQNDPTTIKALGKASTVSISIGSNNLLSPVITTLATAFNLDPTSENFATELAAALADPNNQATIAAAMPELQTNLAAGAQQFTADWPKIIGTIKTLAPQANIYVSTLYDPISSQDPLYQVFDPIIQGINGVIMTPDSGYKVADVYTAFKSYQGVDPLVNFNWYTGNLDPHPTTLGHSVIYQCLLNSQTY
ncbi:hypothetical protein GH807_06485 [Acetobacterium tundrae]|uniref:SGNH hydrolase-type esterase domain-containing protein n=2 Tax=Acetobacterium tundrae TaxID=132932 RepID=A0ABR6WJM5_9FIRM|nr:hypothetical protein [Acetobacterium tundrae]